MKNPRFRPHACDLLRRRGYNEQRTQHEWPGFRVCSHFLEEARAVQRTVRNFLRQKLNRTECIASNYQDILTWRPDAMRACTSVNASHVMQSLPLAGPSCHHFQNPRTSNCHSFSILRYSLLYLFLHHSCLIWPHKVTTYTQSLACGPISLQEDLYTYSACTRKIQSNECFAVCLLNDGQLHRLSFILSASNHNVSVQESPTTCLHWGNYLFR